MLGLFAWRDVSRSFSGPAGDLAILPVVVAWQGFYNGWQSVATLLQRNGAAHQKLRGKGHERCTEGAGAAERTGTER